MCEGRFKVGQLLFDFGVPRADRRAAAQQLVPLGDLGCHRLMLPLHRNDHE